LPSEESYRLLVVVVTDRVVATMAHLLPQVAVMTAATDEVEVAMLAVITVRILDVIAVMVLGLATTMMVTDVAVAMASSSLVAPCKEIS
jgi:hypothetical protein